MTHPTARLDHLRRHDVLADAEYEVAREAMLGSTKEVGAGRSVRVEAYRVLSPPAGGPFIIMDLLTKFKLCKYDWTQLALRLDSHQLRDHLLGLTYESAAERWDDLLAKLELLPQARQEEHLSREQFATVKYGVLGRLKWLDLVGELVWMRRDVDGLTFWRREDGWGVSDEDVRETINWLAIDTPYEKSPVRDQRIHHYYDWIDDQAWRHYNRMIAEGDFGFLQTRRVLRIDQGEWTY